MITNRPSYTKTLSTMSTILKVVHNYLIIKEIINVVIRSFGFSAIVGLSCFRYELKLDRLKACGEMP